MSKLFINFFWHFHQPYYKDLIDNVYLLPYTKIHLIKNYYMMGKIIERNKNKVNFNFTPILLEQINDYEEKYSKCIISEYSNLDLDYIYENKKVIVKKILSFLSPTTINKYERLKELCNNKIEDFNVQDILDLTTLFNLSFIPDFEKDEKLVQIENKKRNYSDWDRFIILEKQDEIIKKVLPLYKQLFKENIIEITTSPYSHPIIPLIIDTDIAKRCGEFNLPKERFSHPEDILEQIKLGNEIFVKNFDRKPIGFWPPEGGVSDEIIDILINNNFKYFATDEEILFKTLKSNSRENLYKPYFIKRDDKKIYIFFRDKILSDLIGFRYSSMSEYDAVNDLLLRVRSIKDNLKKDRSLIILLDGENAWEFYKNNGFDFLNLLYDTLSKENNILITKASEILDSVESQQLDYIETGSWINGDFKTWIGEEEDNLSWDYLKIIRDDFVGLSEDNKERVKKILFILEGSDWNWWYGKSYGNDIKKNFDYLYRRHTQSFYLYSGLKAKPFIFKPIIVDENKFINLSVKGYITPNIDGKITNFYEWENGFYYENEEKLSEIVSYDKFFEYIRGGFDKDNLYLLIKINKEFKSFEIEIILNSFEEKNNLIFNFNDKKINIKNNLSVNVEYVMNDVLEMKIPFFEKMFSLDKKISFFILFYLNNKPISKIPDNGAFLIDVDEEKLKAEWIV